MNRSRLSMLIVVALVVTSVLAVPAAAQEDPLAANKALATRAVQAFKEADWDAFRAVVADDFALHFPLSLVDIAGPEGLIAFFQGFHVAMPDVHFSADDMLMVAEGNLVALHWVAYGTHTGDVPGIPASGSAVTVSGVSFYRLEDGKIAETWFMMDTLGFLTQIGVIPAA